MKLFIRMISFSKTILMILSFRPIHPPSVAPLSAIRTIIANKAGATNRQQIGVNSYQMRSAWKRLINFNQMVTSWRMIELLDGLLG